MKRRDMQLNVMSCSLICAHVTYCIVTQYRQCNVCDAMKGEGVKLIRYVSLVCCGCVGMGPCSCLPTYAVIRLCM